MKIISWNVAGLRACLKKGFHFSYCNRPKNSLYYHLQNHCVADKKKVGIVIQGPVVKKYDFTFESVVLYKKIYPNCPIVLSTWDGFNNTDRKKFEDEGINVITSQIPNQLYGTNVLRQSVSSYNGLKVLKSLGCDYAIKTRTDQRMYANDLIPYLLSLVKSFSSDNTSKIFTCDGNMFFNTLYDLNDMWNFGSIENMLMYWDLSDFNSVFSEKDKLQLSNNHWPETILFSHYLKKIGKELKWTMEDTLYYLAHNAVVVNSNDIDLFWLKSNMTNLKKTYSSLKYDDFTSRHWMILYQDQHLKMHLFTNPH